MQARHIKSGEIRDIIVSEALSKIVMISEYGLDNKFPIEDSFESLMFLGPPGVGKSALQYLAIKDVARLLSEIRNRPVRAKKISIRIEPQVASEVVNDVVNGKVVPYVHLYLPQTKLWDLEGTPSPMDNFIDVQGVKVPYNLWRIDPFLVPMLDYTSSIKNPDQIVTPLLVIDEFNMGGRDVLRRLFQLARGAELGRAKLNPFTIITLLGNPPESNIYAEEELAEPLVNRASRYMITAVSLDGWLAFMNEVYGKKWSQEIGGFLLGNPALLYFRDKSDKEVVITPRTWTILSVRLYSLKMMVSKYKLIGRDKYWDNVEKLLYSHLTTDVADELYGFLRGLMAINLADIIKDPQKISSLDRNLVSYLLVKITNYQMENYKRADKETRESIIKKLTEIYHYAKKVIGAEALGIIVTSLPEPVRIKYAKLLRPEDREEIREIKRKIKEYEEALGV